MKTQSDSTWILASLAIIAALSLARCRKEEPPRTTAYSSFTNVQAVGPGTRPPPIKAGEIPLKLHSGVKGVRVDSESNHLVVRIPLGPELEKLGLRVSVDHYLNSTNAKP